MLINGNIDICGIRVHFSPTDVIFYMGGNIEINDWENAIKVPIYKLKKFEDLVYFINSKKVFYPNHEKLMKEIIANRITISHMINTSEIYHYTAEVIDMSFEDDAVVSKFQFSEKGLLIDTSYKDGQTPRRVDFKDYNEFVYEVDKSQYKLNLPTYPHIANSLKMPNKFKTIDDMRGHVEVNLKKIQW